MKKQKLVINPVYLEKMDIIFKRLGYTRIPEREKIEAEDIFMVGHEILYFDGADVISFGLNDKKTVIKYNKLNLASKEFTEAEIAASAKLMKGISEEVQNGKL